MRYHSEHGEWRVSMNIDWLRERLGIDYTSAQNMNEALAAYTTDADDAMGAARHFAERYA